MRKTRLTAMVVGTTLYLSRLCSNYYKRRVAEFETEAEADAAGLALSLKIKKKNEPAKQKVKPQLRKYVSLRDKLKHIKMDQDDGTCEVVS